YAPHAFLSALTQKAEKQWEGLTCNVIPIRNDFFGERITVTGLITGQDLIAQLKGKDLGDELLLSSSMIRRDSDVFLDDVTIGEVEAALQTKIRLIANDGYELLDAILGIVY
ncbi:MAG: DUF512 domain-containing protein, partial [Oscillospiraceae bacterium]|nr:DUF512 domain-containing protein [Oscillospiraceae bacterium]